MRGEFCPFHHWQSTRRAQKMPDQSVNCVITSPPYLKKRDYLPLDHADKADEIGQEDSPAEFLASLLRITDELWRVVRDDGTIWINLGDTAAGSGGAGGDYNEGGLREGQPRFRGTPKPSTDHAIVLLGNGFPAQAVCPGPTGLSGNPCAGFPSSSGPHSPMAATCSAASHASSG